MSKVVFEVEIEVREALRLAALLSRAALRECWTGEKANWSEFMLHRRLLRDMAHDLRTAAHEQCPDACKLWINDSGWSSVGLPAKKK